MPSVTVEQSYDAHTKKINAKGVLTSAEIPYVVFNAADEDEALQAVLADAPSALGSVPLNSVELTAGKTAQHTKSTPSTRTILRMAAMIPMTTTTPAQSASTAARKQTLTHKHQTNARKRQHDPKAQSAGTVNQERNARSPAWTCRTAQLRETYTRT